MKKITIILTVIINIFLSFYIFNIKSNKNVYLDTFRLHIRANSNSADDQYTKYFIKDKIINLFSPHIDKIKSSDDAILFINNSVSLVNDYVNYLLKKINKKYTANVTTGVNYFEPREINGCYFESGYYQSMIISLGNGVGNNWWGLIYPNFSYFGNKLQNSDDIIYKSKIVEIYNSFVK